jgi:hypothetical protein
MPNIINADNGVVSGFAGVRTTADGTGNLALQSNGVTLVTLATNNTVTIAGTTTGSGNITTTGSVGAGTTSPTEMLTVGSTSNRGNARVVCLDGNGLNLQTGGGGGGSGAAINFFDADTNYAAKIATSKSAGNTADLLFYTANGSAAFTERMRINSVGNLLVGTTTTPSSGQGTIAVKGNGTYFSFGSQTNGSTSFVVFNSGGTGVYLTDGGTSWTANSDERLKTNLNPILNGLAKVNALRSVTGRYKTDAEGISRAFLIAQDVQKVLPEATNIPDKETGYIGLQYTDTIPLLVAAIKELNAKVDAQAAEIAALKAGK